jgi:hypothetical protein
LESIGVCILERVTDPALEKRPEESIGVHRGQSSRMSRAKLKSEAGTGCKSSGESIGVHRSQSFKKSNEPSLRKKPKVVNRSSLESKFQEE